MKAPLPAALSTALIMAMTALSALPASAQTAGGGHNIALSFDTMLGARTLPRYEGSDQTKTRPWAVLRNYSLQVGDEVDGIGPPQGLSFAPSYALIGKRSTGASAMEPLRGLDPVDRGLELGVLARYQTGPVRFYGAARKAIRGHRGVTGELGVAMTMHPADRWTVVSSVEAQYGDQKFMDAYFGISDDEAARSFEGYDPYAVSGGVKAHALTVEARWQATEDWSLIGRVEAKRLVGDAADSPVVRDRDQFWFGFGVARSFNFRF